MIECTNISLSFSEKKIFDQFNLRVKEGEHLCLSGVSGKGKTTLLKLLQGYIIPNAGQIFINDLQLAPATIKEIRDFITWIPQNVNLPVSNGLGLIKLLHIQAKTDYINNLCHQLGLEDDILSKDFDIISGGQKQRILISICLCLDKKIILMDEPTASLDNKSISLLINLLDSLEGKTILSASHNQQWVNSAGNTITL
jgi:polar amino acid transport system ATP-binding protein/putative ABC transport system ATP-binding protein